MNSRHSGSRNNSGRRDGVPDLLPGAEPFFFPGNRTGCLLIHGFTGSPFEMRPMGEYLAGRGYTTLGVRLFAHATQPEDMVRATWQDWMRSVIGGWHLLQGACDRIYLLGLSMGGLLSLMFAAQPYAERYPVAGVVAMSTPYALRPDPRLPYIKLLRWFMPRLEKGPNDFQDAQAAQTHVAYPYYPTRAIAELRDLVAEVQAALPEVKAPVLLVHSRLDTANGDIDPESMQHIYEQLGSQDKEMLWLESSGHVITRDQERERLFLAAGEFIERTTKIRHNEEKSDPSK
jgi:carboxylesterase